MKRFNDLIDKNGLDNVQDALTTLNQKWGKELKQLKPKLRLEITYWEEQNPNNKCIWCVDSSVPPEHFGVMEKLQLEEYKRDRHEFNWIH